MPTRRAFLGATAPILTGCLDGGEWRVEVTSPVEEVELPRSEIPIEVTNHTDERVSPGFLTVWKVKEVKPVYLQPVTPADIFPHMGVRIGPGQSETLELTVDSEAETMDAFLPGAGPGTYLWGFLEEDHKSDKDAYGPHKRRVTEIELVGEKPEITPVYVDETEKTDDGLRVKMNDGTEDNNGDHTEIVVSADGDARRTAPDDIPELIQEQVFGFAVVRNAVYYLGIEDETDRVVFEGEAVEDEKRILEGVLGEDRYPYFSSDGNRLFFEYDDNAYRVETI